MLRAYIERFRAEFPEAEIAEETREIKHIYHILLPVLRAKIINIHDFLKINVYAAGAKYCFYSSHTPSRAILDAFIVHCRVLQETIGAEIASKNKVKESLAKLQQGLAKLWENIPAAMKRPSQNPWGSPNSLPQFPKPLGGKTALKFIQDLAVHFENAPGGQEYEKAKKHWETL